MLRQPQREYLNKLPFIAFYGGEPLLNFELINGVISYVKRTFPSLNVHYTLTTNGLPLKNKKIADYLKSNSVIICVSIDGYEDNHNRNRLTAEGMPSYKEVHKIIDTYFSDYPLIYSLCCIDYKTDLKKLHAYYMENDRICGGKMPHVLRISQVFDLGTNYYSQFTDEDRLQFVEGWRYLEGEFIKLAKENKSNWLLDILIGQELTNIYDRPKFNRSSVYNINGCCIPGDKLYVLPDGSFGACEKVGVLDLKIGDINSGINFEKVINLIQKINAITEKYCSGCEISAACSICYSTMIDHDTLGYTTEKCENKKRNFIHGLEVIQEIEKTQPDFFEKRIKRAILRNRTADISRALSEVMLK